jgi:regulator of protease activity HflC (stomatin/prohibitin superfamily)
MRSGTSNRAARRAGDPRPWPFSRMSVHRARRAATLTLAVMTVLALLGVSGLKFERQPLGYVGVVRNGGPLDNRQVRQILLPGQRVTFTGLFSQAPHNYPSTRSLRSYTITADAARGNRPGVDVVSVPTRDGVQVGLEGTVYLRFAGEVDRERLVRFDSTVGTRRFPLPDGSALFPWQGSAGFAAMLDGVFRPILDNNLRREVGAFDCAQLVASCSLVRPARKSAGATASEAIRKIEKRIDASLAADLLSTVGQPYFRELRFRLVRVTLPDSVQGAIDKAQAEYANVNGARARLAQAHYEARRTRLLGKAYRQSPSVATIDAIKSVPTGATVIVNTGAKGSQSPPIALGGN